MPNKKKQIDARIPKSIIRIAKILHLISPALAEKFARKLFITPIKYPIPKREIHMEEASIQSTIHIPNIKKDIVVYEYGQSNKKVLLIHGWSGRGTQLVKIADELLENGYSTISFDAPAHGKSGSKTTIMIEFIECILELEKKFGPFEFGIAHSLGAMALLNAIKKGLQIKKGVIIGSGNSVLEILDEFVHRIGLPKSIAEKMKQSFESQYKFEMESLSAYIAAKDVHIPILVIHDNQDYDVPVHAAHAIAENLSNHELIITNELGHRKILGDKAVIQRIISFILSK
jgi:pimeloyl-ACP methyl ester carboxylesterase